MVPGFGTPSSPYRTFSQPFCWPLTRRYPPPHNRSGTGWGLVLAPRLCSSHPRGASITLYQGGQMAGHRFSAASLRPLYDLSAAYWRPVGAGCDSRRGSCPPHFGVAFSSSVLVAYLVDLTLFLKQSCLQGVPQMSSCRNMPLHHDMSSCYDMSSCHGMTSCHDMSECRDTSSCRGMPSCHDMS